MEEQSPQRPGRRRVLATVAVLGGVTTLPGCSALRDGAWNQPGATDVVVHNAGADRRTVTVRIVESDAADPHTSRTLSVAPGETVDPVNRSKLPTNDSYTVEVSVRDGPSETFEWDDPDLELAPLWVLVDGSENVRFLLQAG